MVSAMSVPSPWIDRRFGTGVRSSRRRQALAPRSAVALSEGTIRLLLGPRCFLARIRRQDS